MSDLSPVGESTAARRDRFYHDMAVAEERLQADAELLAHYVIDREAWLTPDLD